MKYGIKHNTGVVIAISRFTDNIVPNDFVEITESDYIKFLNDLKTNPYCTYDDVNNDLIQNTSNYADLVDSNNKLDLRNQLRNLSIELDLQTKMGEDTTDTQADFDAKKTQYNAL